jgi:hypothetical protein
MSASLTLTPTKDSRQFRGPDGALLTAPPGWDVLPPGDAALTRRVKAAGPSWAVVEKRGRKTFSRGLWAPVETIAAERRKLEAERATPAYTRRLEADRQRRERQQAAYVEEFTREVREFLNFARRFAALGEAVAKAVAEHATPVGSGTVARTRRISVARRAEAAVIAWLRHQTTAYDSMKVARIKGERRRVRRELAERSRRLLDVHRRGDEHDSTSCPLCAAVGGR